MLDISFVGNAEVEVGLEEPAATIMTPAIAMRS